MSDWYWANLFWCSYLIACFSHVFILKMNRNLILSYTKIAWEKTKCPKNLTASKISNEFEGMYYVGSSMVVLLLNTLDYTITYQKPFLSQNPNYRRLSISVCASVSFAFLQPYHWICKLQQIAYAYNQIIFMFMCNLYVQ